MPEEIGLFEAIRTTRAMRRLKPDPVPDELIHQVIAAGVCALVEEMSSTGVSLSSEIRR